MPKFEKGARVEAARDITVETICEGVIGEILEVSVNKDGETQYCVWWGVGKGGFFDYETWNADDDLREVGDE
jgi:hypothetical protein